MKYLSFETLLTFNFEFILNTHKYYVTENYCNVFLFIFL